MTRDKRPMGKTLIVGLGKTGLSCIRHLSAQGVSLAVTDSREAPPGLERLSEEYPDTAMFLGEFQAEVFQAAEQLVVSPGVSMNEPLIQAAKERGVEVVGDVELFARAVDAPVVAITGTNGKSTVTTLVGEMASQAGVKVAVGGNLGQPALNLLNDEAALYVLELSSFQLESTWSLKPKVAVVLNISADHMDRYPNFEAYAKAKARIYQQAACFLVNRDDPNVMGMVNSEVRTLGFTLNIPRGRDFGRMPWKGSTWLCQGDTPLISVDELRISGRHNQANALAALALGSVVGLPRDKMLEALRNFSGLPHRTQWISDKMGLRWYDDSKGTNVGATCSALMGLHPEQGERRTVLIAGGECKSADFSSLALVVEKTARAVILIGRDASRLADALGDRTKLVFATSMIDAVSKARDEARPGDRVLLSPACASFDMFSNFEARGEAFIEAVEAMDS
jgi:UDP-N-acetylmuramoylalanine--D-glutamate ligase